jgi:hypothetical protein
MRPEVQAPSGGWNPWPIDSSGYPEVNCITGCSGGGGNAAAGTTGVASPSNAGLTGYTNGSGNLTAVSPSTPLPTTGTINQGAPGSTSWLVTQSVPSTAIATAIALTTASTAQQLPSNALTVGVVLQNQSVSDAVCIGTSSGVAYSATGPNCQNGYKLAAGQSQGFAVSNTNLLYWVGPTVGTSTAGDYLGVSGN